MIKMRSLLKENVIGIMQSSIFADNQKIGTVKLIKDFIWKSGGDSFGKRAGSILDVYGVDFDKKELRTDLGLTDFSQIDEKSLKITKK